MPNILAHTSTPQKKAKIYIATPCYGGVVTVSYTASLLELKPVLAHHGYDLHVKFRSGESLISRGRNSLVADFLGRTDCDYLLFIDADIGFIPADIITLLQFDKPIVACKVPLKGINWQNVFDHRNNVNNYTEMQTAATYFNYNVSAEDNIATQVDEQGFLQVEMVGAAFMLIKREVFNLLMEKLPDIHYMNDIPSYDTDYSKGNFWGFFDTLIHPLSKRYLSEDFAFCYRWRHYCDGEIYMYTKARVTHVGSYHYTV